MSDNDYRAGVGIILINSDKKVFVAKRLDMISENWQMPQGGIDDGETPQVAAMREMQEEIGTNNATIIAESKDWYYYDLPSELVAKVWKGRYKGQKQKWFVMDFQGSDADINIDTAHPEFSEWKWIEPKDLPDIIVPFKRKLYQDLLEEFKQCLS